MKGVFDSDIVIDYLSNDDRASNTVAACEDKLISRVTYIEVLVGAENTAEEARIRSLLARFRIVELTPAIADRAIELRRSHVPRLKTPDSIIYATAKEEGCNLFTRNTKDFSSSDSDVTVPYTF